jgi:hypothetical protein
MNFFKIKLILIKIKYIFNNKYKEHFLFYIIIFSGEKTLHLNNI